MKTLFLFLLLIGCGAAKLDPSQLKQDPKDPQPFVLAGSVTSAFQVTVDGAKYPDLESYYTHEITQLSAQAAAAGYPGYDAAFEAEVGYTDLANGMLVFVSPETNRGYSGQTTVDSDGTFSIPFPAEAAGDTYQVKATKRIGLTLTNPKDPQDTKNFCWNFNAQDLSVKYSDKDKPIVLNTFVSVITAYKCQAGNSVMTIPKNPNNPASGSNASGTPANGSVSNTSGTSGVTPDSTPELVYVGNSPNPLLRIKGQVSEMTPKDVLQNTVDYNGTPIPVTLVLTIGSASVLVKAPNHNLQPKDVVYFQGKLLQSLRAYRVTSVTQDAFTFNLSQPATETKTYASTKDSYSVAILAKGTPVFTGTPVSRFTESGYAYTIGADGTVCWDGGTVCR